MAIDITLESPLGDASHRAKMDENTSIEQLIPAVIEALGLPAVMPLPIYAPVNYHLEHNGCRLKKTLTLTEANIKTGDILTISFEFKIKVISVPEHY